jgi:hypothetical protein
MQTEEFKRDVETRLTGPQPDSWKLLYFKVHESQMRVIKQVLETEGLIQGDEHETRALSGDDLR